MQSSAERLQPASELKNPHSFDLGAVDALLLLPLLLLLLFDGRATDELPLLLLLLGAVLVSSCSVMVFGIDTSPECVTHWPRCDSW